MSVDTTLDTSLALIVSKARSGLSSGTIPITSGGSSGGTVSSTARTATVNFEWGGGGSALSASACDPVLVEVPFASEIMWVHLFAGIASGAPVAVTTTLDLQLTRWASFGGSTPVYGSGTSPRITADSLGNMSLSGWFVNMTSGDVLIARVLTFSGTATFLTMNILLRSSDVPIGISGVSDGSGGTVVDASGNRIVWRS
jgi:hypothetical protein